MQYLRLFAAAAALVTATTADAATLVTNGGVAQMAYPSSGTVSFQAGAGAGSVSFTLTGYNTVDGMNAIQGGTDYSDLFTVSLNGTTLFSGYFVLGGIGSDAVVTQAAGTTFTKVAPTTNNSGSVNFNSAVNLAAGNNTLTFAYSTPTPQAYSDESFGISGVTVTGAAPAAAVPEPAAWAMMVLGLGAMGYTLRGRARPATRLASA